MFDPKSDYALNKLDPNAIVYKSADGIHTRLTREDFASEEEFQRWKAWSDGDYDERETVGRDFYDNCVQMDERIDTVTSVPSVETILVTAQREVEMRQKHKKAIADALASVKSQLTKKQYRRVWMRLVMEMSVEKIAIQEHVTPQAVYACLAKAKVRIVNKL